MFHTILPEKLGKSKSLSNMLWEGRALLNECIVLDFVALLLVTWNIQNLLKNVLSAAKSFTQLNLRKWQSKISDHLKLRITKRIGKTHALYNKRMKQQFTLQYHPNDWNNLRISLCFTKMVVLHKQETINCKYY